MTPLRTTDHRSLAVHYGWLDHRAHQARLLGREVAGGQSTAGAPDLRTLMDNDRLVTERRQPRGLPASYFVDPEGKLRYLALGGRPWDTPEYLEFLHWLIAK